MQTESFAVKIHACAVWLATNWCMIIKWKVILRTFFKPELKRHKTNIFENVSILLIAVSGVNMYIINIYIPISKIIFFVNLKHNAHKWPRCGNCMKLGFAKVNIFVRTSSVTGEIPCATSICCNVLNRIIVKYPVRTVFHLHCVETKSLPTRIAVDGIFDRWRSISIVPACYGV